MATDLAFGRVSPDLPAEHPHRKYAGRLIIPSFSARGTITDIAFRCIADHPDCGVLGHPKYLFAEGSTKRLYNVSAVNSTSPVIHVCEGQLNTATLTACGEAAVGATGADSWKPHYWRLLQGFERVLVWKDGDDKEPKPLPDGTPRVKGGDLFTGKVRSHVRNAEVVECPPGYDVNSFFVEHGRDALLALANPVVEDSYDGSTTPNEEAGQDAGVEGTDEPEDWSDGSAGSGISGSEGGRVHLDELGDVIPF